MEQCNCNNGCDSVAKCDIFDFMAKHVGLTVIHPGGLNATKKICRILNIQPDSKVIDIACGKGTTAIFIAERYGCNVTAIDIDEELINEAKYLTKKKGLVNKITYLVGDAIKLPFKDNEFDVAISQAMLVLVDDKTKAIQEAKRVIKKDGAAGWLELSWRKEISNDFLNKVSSVICAYCMTNVSTFEGWRKVFAEAGISNLEVIPLEFKPHGGGFIDMLKDEGLLRTISIIANIVKNNEIKNRMKIMNKFFQENNDVFSCGIYYFLK